jgi:hypothetical protein
VLALAKLSTGMVVSVCATRHFIRQALEAGGISILSNEYGLGVANASYILSGILGLFPFYVAFLGKLATKYSDVQLITAVDLMEITGVLFMFRVTAPSMTTLAVLLVGITVLYINNLGQAGLLTAVLVKHAVPGHKWLNMDFLLIYYNLCVSLGYLIGPLLTRWLLQISYTQNVLAGTVLVVGVCQVSITAIYFHGPGAASKNE